MEDAGQVESRSGEPEERIASLLSACPSCSLSILPGDRIASSPATGVGWRHLKCAICQQCGAWLGADGDCSAACGEEDAGGSWHDMSVTVLVPPAAFEFIAPSSSAKLLHYRTLAATELERPRYGTLSRVRAHAQVFIEGATDPGADIIVREVAKAIGTLLGNKYDYFTATKVACDFAVTGIENRQTLSRAPAWAAEK
jgi:hypothetical protein